MEGIRKIRGLKWLVSCAALAAGEFVASRAPWAAGVWPVCAAAAALVALFGYGLAVRQWHLPAIMLAGAALFLHASVADEEAFRLRPWMRAAAERRRAQPSAAGRAAAVRRDFSARVGIGLGCAREAAALNRAILLGERAGIPRDARRAFVESGAMHVFAISGLHVMAIAHTLCFFLRMLFVPRRFAGAVAIPALWAYIWVIGSPPSAVRAAAMASLGCAAPLFGRRPDGVMAWAVTFLAVYVMDPLKIVNVGCGLSFLVMLSILLSCAGGAPGGLRGAARVALAAWLAGAPVMAYAFGRVTPGGLLASLVLMPVATLSVAVGVAGLGASFVSETLAAHLNGLSALFTEAMAGLAVAVARLPFANFETGQWPLWACIAWYAALAALSCVIAALRRRAGQMGP